PVVRHADNHLPQSSLASSCFANTPECLPPPHLERDPINRTHGAPAGVVVDPEARGFEHGVAHDLSFLRTGFMISFSPSPKKLSPIVSRTMMRPGKKDDHQIPTLIRLEAADRSSPQSAVGASPPTPR